MGCGVADGRAETHSDLLGRKEDLRRVAEAMLSKVGIEASELNPPLMFFALRVLF